MDEEDREKWQKIGLAHLVMPVRKRQLIDQLTNELDIYDLQPNKTELKLSILKYLVNKKREKLLNEGIHPTVQLVRSE